MRRRREFLAANAGKRQVTPGFILLARERRDGDPSVRVGFTCSKKVGGAVQRNRARRRLREVARAVLPHHARPGWDYVLIGRRETTATRPFERLKDDLAGALARIHGRD